MIIIVCADFLKELESSRSSAGGEGRGEGGEGRGEGGGGEGVRRRRASGEQDGGAQAASEDYTPEQKEAVERFIHPLSIFLCT